MITEEEIKRRLDYLEMMDNNMTKYGGPEGKIAWSGIYPKTNKAGIYPKTNKAGIYPKTNEARIDLVKDDELYGNLFSIYFIIRIIGE